MEHSSLLCSLARFTKGVTKRPMEIQKAWRASGDSDFLYQRQSHGGYAAGFDLSCQQSHGPRANRSSRHEKNQVDSRFADTPGYFPDSGHQRLSTSHQAEAVVFVGQPPNHMFSL